MSCCENTLKKVAFKYQKHNFSPFRRICPCPTSRTSLLFRKELKIHNKNVFELNLLAKQRHGTFPDSPTDSQECPVPAARRSLSKRDSSEDGGFVAAVPVSKPRPGSSTFFKISTFEESRTDYRKISYIGNKKWDLGAKETRQMAADENFKLNETFGLVVEHKSHNWAIAGSSSTGCRVFFFSVSLPYVTKSLTEV